MIKIFVMPIIYLFIFAVKLQLIYGKSMGVSKQEMFRVAVVDVLPLPASPSCPCYFLAASRSNTD